MGSESKCDTCGREVERAESLRPWSSWLVCDECYHRLTGAAWADIQRETEDNDAPQLASRWLRFCAAFLDSLIALAIAVPVLWATGVTEQVTLSRLDFETRAALFLFGQVLFLTLHGYLLYSRGQTIGKLLCQIRILNLAGNTSSLGKVYLLRYMAWSLAVMLPHFGAVFAFGDLIFIFGPQRRCLHDYLADTRVVKAA